MASQYYYVKKLNFVLGLNLYVILKTVKTKNEENVILFIYQGLSPFFYYK